MQKTERMVLTDASCLVIESMDRAAMACGLEATRKSSYPVMVGVGFGTEEIILSPRPIRKISPSKTSPGCSLATPPCNRLNAIFFYDIEILFYHLSRRTT